MVEVIRIGTRPSRLALKQAQEICKRLPGINLEIIPIATKGDKDKHSTLFGREDSDFFSGEIEQALLSGRIDAAVHSAKDLEKNIPGGLVIVAITSSLSPFEALVSRGDLRLEELPQAAKVATSSLQRKAAVLRFRPDLRVEGIRGDIDERLAQLYSGKFDALIIAHAALLRLGYEKRVAQVIPKEIIAPHPLQGRLAIQIRQNRQDLWPIFRRLHEK